ncbi:hypothetical protein [Halegenticoccus soli]|nr:hypothetical protein [Halegenticoccus soli]
MSDAVNCAEAEERERHDDHLADLEDGSGCTEIWEHLSERRERAEVEE